MLKGQLARACATAFGVLVVSGHAVADSWDRFEFIEWQSRPEAAYQGLQRLGVTAAALIADRDHPDRDPAARLAPIAAPGLRYYVENIATDFYAPYHRWRAGLAVNALYDETIARWRADPADPAVFWRQPSLVDPAWRQRIEARLQATVRSNRRFRPLFYNLGDETGIADLSAAWDFDRSPESLAAMRAWLARQYGSLDALNGEWGTHYATWDAVTPDTTSAAMKRTDGNYASWSDFKAWMDWSFADAVRAGTDAVHAAEPGARAGIEGGQMAGWGGYDYSRLAPAVDVMEIYGDATNVDIAHDMHPGLITLATAYTADPHAPAAMWRAALRGSRGFVLWDEDGALVRDDGSAGPAASGFAPVLSALHGPAGAALLSSVPLAPRVAILYSPASFRAQWMLDHRNRGDAWVARGSEGENDDNPWRAAMRGAAEQLLRLGLRPLWLSPEQLARGVPAGIEAVLLPHILALGDDEARALAAFERQGGRAFADIAPGAFDAHLRPRLEPAVNAELTPSPWLPADAPAVAETRRLLAQAGIAPPVDLTNTDGSVTTDVEIRMARRKEGLIISVLGTGAERTVRLSLAPETYAYDVLTGNLLGHSPSVAITLNSTQPAIVSVQRPKRRAAQQ